jgi:hypothetical protein
MGLMNKEEFIKLNDEFAKKWGVTIKTIESYGN